MQALSNDNLLTAWERGRAEPHAAGLALALLAAAYPEAPPDALAALTIGERDGLLLAIRERMFGPHLDGLVACGACGETLEVEFPLPRVEAPPAHADHESLRLRSGDYELAFRLPNSMDLLAIVPAMEGAPAALRRLEGAPEAGRDRLLERVILHASHNGEPVPFSSLPAPLLSQLEQAMAAADPQADVQLKLTCQACGNQWLSPFDIVSFLWRELDAWAIRVLHEVHTLARAYGWREADILNMRPWRRQCYLEMLGA